MRRKIELPTLGIWLLIHGAWLALTWWWSALPWWVLLAAAGPLVCWHSSYQHEAVHGHPTGVRWVDHLLAALPVGLWMPFGRYREIHSAHHRADLTCPLTDPESFYVTPAAWRGVGPLGRTVLRLNATSGGRLLLGPAVAVCRFWFAEARGLCRGDRRCLAHWTLHAVGVGLVIAWFHFARVPLGEYVLFAVYPGLALTLLRSFAEHHAAPDAASRSAMVRTWWPMRLLYLNNTFHALHHREPRLPWYRLPARARKSEAGSGYPVDGYLSVVRRHFFRAWDHPVHPAA